MKHRLHITLILLGMFFLTQLIGLFVVNSYTPDRVFNPATGEISEAPGNELPFGLQTSQTESSPNFVTILFSFSITLAIIFILMKYKWKMVIRLWFLFVIVFALGISLNTFVKLTPFQNTSLIAILIAIPLALLKIFRPHVITHNFTELLIYPGIAAVFVPLFIRPEAVSFFGKVWPAIAILVIISFYDMWAVWKSGIMQKMAKFQMEELKIFGGFLIPTLSPKVRDKIKKIRDKYQKKKMPDKIKKMEFKVNVAILGGGDIIFPIIVAGVFMRASSSIIPALFVTLGALVGLSFLFMITKKGRSYPAMPYITAGIFLGIILAKMNNIV